MLRVPLTEWSWETPLLGSPGCPTGSPTHKHVPASPALRKITPCIAQGKWIHTGILLDFLWAPGCPKLLSGFSAPRPITGLHSGGPSWELPALHCLRPRPSYNWIPSPCAQAATVRQTQFSHCLPLCQTAPPRAHSCAGHSQALLQYGLPAQSPLAVPPILGCQTLHRIASSNL